MPGWIDEWRRRGTAYEVAKLMTAPARRALVRLRVEGVEHLPAEGSAIIAANHLSFFDSVLLMFALPRRVCMLGKAEYADRRLTRWLFCGAGMIPVRRQRLGEATHALDVVSDVLAEGHVVGLFPEGTRSRDGLLHRGHTGVAHLALVTVAPIVPVGLEGTDAILPSGSRFVRPFHTATLRLGPPLLVADLGFEHSTNRARKVVTEELMQRIRALSHQTYVDEFAPLPATTPG